MKRAAEQRLAKPRESRSAIKPIDGTDARVLESDSRCPTHNRHTYTVKLPYTIHRHYTSTACTDSDVGVANALD